MRTTEEGGKVKGQSNNTPIGPLGDISHKRTTLFGKRLSVIRLDGEDFLIGVQIASLLKRETFNMYRSMKIKNILIQRANVEQVDFLCKCNAVRTGTHSVTLIPYHSALFFISEAMARQKKSNDQTETPIIPNNNHINNLNTSIGSIELNNQPKIHRRKANRSEVHRSIKQQDLHLFDHIFVDFNTPFDDLIAIANKFAKSRNNLSASDDHHHHLHFALLEKKQARKKTKSNPLHHSHNNINNLLFAAGSLEDDELPVDSLENSPTLSPISLTSSSSSLSNSFPSSPSFSSISSSPDVYHFNLPQFNLGIFSDANSNNTNIITKELNTSPSPMNNFMNNNTSPCSVHTF